MSRIIDELKRTDHKRYLGGLDFFKYIGPGLLVTVGFIDPGNWASNFAAGSEFGYALLWVVTLSTIMLIVLQHNVAHLGIVTGLCLSEAATQYCPKWISRPILGSAVLASISTSLAEILGGAIALQMLLEIPIAWGSVLTTMFVVIMLFSNSYKKIERAIIAFVSVIGLSFLYELFLVDIDWPVALQQAKSLLDPLLGSHAGIIFALALLMAGISSTITSGMAAGSIFAGIFGESYHIKDIHSKVGILISLGIALVLIFFIENPFYGLIISQMILSIQLPFTVFLQVGLTSSKRVMGKYANSRWSSFVLYTIAVIVSALNIMLLLS